MLLINLLIIIKKLFFKEDFIKDIPVNIDETVIPCFFTRLSFLG